MAKKQMTFRLDNDFFNYADGLLSCNGVKLNKTEILEAAMKAFETILFRAVQDDHYETVYYSVGSDGKLTKDNEALKRYLDHESMKYRTFLLVHCGVKIHDKK